MSRTPVRGSSAERWSSKVVDAPHHRSHSSSRRRLVDSPNQYASVNLPGPSSLPYSGISNPPPVQQSTPRRRCHPGGSPMSVVSPSPATIQQNVSLLIAKDSSYGRDDVRFSRRMVATPRGTSGSEGRAASPVVPTVNTNAGTTTPPLFSKRMNPKCGGETVQERTLSTASTDIEVGRGRAHSPAHRNYTDHVRCTWQQSASCTSGSGSPATGTRRSGSNPGMAMAATAASPPPSASIHRLRLDAAAEAELLSPARPQLRSNGQKNFESRTEASHWKPTVEKRCASPRPSLVGIMSADPPARAPAFRLVPPYGVSL